MNTILIYIYDFLYEIKNFIKKRLIESIGMKSLQKKERASTLNPKNLDAKNPCDDTTSFFEYFPLDDLVLFIL